MNLSKLAIVALLVLVLATFFALDLDRYLSLDYLQAEQRSLRELVRAHPAPSAATFFIAYVVLTAVSIPGAAVMTVAAGALFGLWWGTLIVSFASSLGATLAFLMARYLLRDLVTSRFGAMLERLDAGIRREGGFYLFGLRLVPLFPFFAINLAMGLTAMRTWSFYWISQAGMLAGTFLYVNAGTQLAKIGSIAGIGSPVVLLSFSLLGLFPWLAKKGVQAYRQRRSLAAFPKPKSFDANLIVIGAGAGGLVAAYLGAALKAKTVLIEKDRMGGDCLNSGCVPSKALLRSARIASLVRRAEEFGLTASAPQADFARVMARVRQTVMAVAPHDSVERYTRLGVECIQGAARLISPYEVEVAGRRIAAANIILATGGKPRVPDIPGLASAPFVTSDTVWNLEALPARLLVVGGGPIGCELAQAFARLGSQVTLVTRGPRVLMKEDEEAAELVARRFLNDGIVLRLKHVPLRVEKTPDGWDMVCRSDAGEMGVAFDLALIATGRQAHTSGLGLEDLPITCNADGSILVDACLRTNLPNVFAVGDVIGHYQHTHTASHQAYYAVINALFAPFKQTPVDYSVIPWATFTDPEVARVGLNEQQARTQGIPFELTCYDLGESDRAIAEGEPNGFVKVLTVPGKDRILGATLVGSQASELIAEFVLAMRHGLGLNKILATIHVYPTLGEANKAAAGVWRRAHTSPRVLGWLARYHRWRLQKALR